MNSLIVSFLFFIVGGIIAYFISKYVNNDLNIVKTKCFYCVAVVIGGSAYALLYSKFVFDIYLILLCLLSSTLLLIALYDYLSCEIKDSFLIICGILCVAIFAYKVFYLKDRFGDYLFSFIMTLIFFVSLVLIGKLLFKKDALGSGDVYLACIISIIFKPFVMIVSILIGSLTGSIIEIINIKTKKTNVDKEIAFCPYLCFGFFVAILFANEIMNIL